MQVGGELALASLLLVGLILKCFSLCFVASNRLCRFYLTLTGVDTDKLGTFCLEEEVLTEYRPQTCQTVWAITLTFLAVYLQLL